VLITLHAGNNGTGTANNAVPASPLGGAARVNDFTAADAPPGLANAWSEETGRSSSAAR
jgi:hypothetical protein